MKLLLTYVGIVSTLFGAMAGINKILPNIQSGTKQQQVETTNEQIQEFPTLSEAPAPEIKPEPIKPVKTTPSPVATKIENQDDLKLKQLEYDSKVRKDDQEELERQWKIEEKELERKNQDIADKRAEDLAQAKLIAQRKADADYAAAQKKYNQCKKDLQDCMDDIEGKIMQYSGSARTGLARVYGDDCNRQYRCN